MNIQPITFNNNPKTNFGHTFKVNICIAKPNNNGYEFVSPAKK